MLSVSVTFVIAKLINVWFNDEAFIFLSKDYGVTFEFRRSPDANKNVERVGMKLKFVLFFILNPN